MTSVDAQLRHQFGDEVFDELTVGHTAGAVASVCGVTPILASRTTLVRLYERWRVGEWEGGALDCIRQLCRKLRCVWCVIVCVNRLSLVFCLTTS